MSLKALNPVSRQWREPMIIHDACHVYPSQQGSADSESASQQEEAVAAASEAASQQDEADTLALMDAVS